jgi:hypothetical protein
MTRNKKIIASTFIVIASVLGIGCGSAGNDQGTSFLATGFHTGVPTTSLNYINNLITPLTTDQPTITAQTDGGTVSADGSLYRVTIGLQNRLAKQFIRVVRVDCSYEIAGATIALPTDSVSVSGVIGPQGTITSTGSVSGAGGTTGGSTTGGGTTGGGTTGGTTGGTAASGNDPTVFPNVTVTNQPSEIGVQFAILTPDLFAYLNNNRSSLPEIPFRMVATCTANGVTQAGDLLTSNPVSLEIQFVDTAECCTGGTGNTSTIGGDGTTGVGGDFTEIDETTSGVNTDTTTTTTTTTGQESPSDFIIQ